MAQQQTGLPERLALLAKGEVRNTLTEIKHGIEREGLRITEQGLLSTESHPQALGSALTNDFITTDFSEALLEFITPPESNVSTTIAQVWDIHKFTLSNIGDEYLWPTSMPCFIEDQETIPIAHYGSSNVGRMKSLYRTGLKNRYGSMMQAIAGVHFNFSVPDSFWQQWFELQGQSATQDAISDAYFGLIRNYRRFCWIIPYLYGASPAICRSFIRGQETPLPFEKLGVGSMYLPYATSLRMSDLGYTNDAQSDLEICYNDIDSYVKSLRKAIQTPSAAYEKLNHGDELTQLNANVLQIENELYSPIRPKQPTRSLEKPVDALASRGVNYIEVRALDVNPFSPVGIDKSQFYFLDAFLLYCLVAPSASMSNSDYHQTEDNLKSVVERGRQPGLMLNKGEESILMTRWAEEMFESMRTIAQILDKAHQSSVYSEAVEQEWQKVLDPDKTNSGKLLNILLSSNRDNGEFALSLAKQYKDQILQGEYRYFDDEQLARHAQRSCELQAQIEKSDTQEFGAFLDDYFKMN